MTMMISRKCPALTVVLWKLLWWFSRVSESTASIVTQGESRRQNIRQERTKSWCRWVNRTDTPHEMVFPRFVVSGIKFGSGMDRWERSRKSLGGLKLSRQPNHSGIKMIQRHNPCNSGSPSMIYINCG